MSLRLVDGLVIGNDSTLEEKYKLPILTKGDLDTRVTYAGAWAYATFAHMSPDARKTLTSGAMACVLYGLCGFVEQDKDGDWREEATARSEFTQLPPKDTYSSELFSIVLDVIITTKINWWTTNCHTGPVGTFDSKEYTQAAHTMGHWASTINILTIAGIKGLRTFKPLGLPGEQKLTLSWDLKCRFYLLPAGTRCLVEAYEDAVKLLESPFAGIYSSVEDFIVIPDIYTIIKETPASYHVEAQYLTGKPRADYDDLQTKGHLGMLWAYINSMINKVQDYTEYAIKLATVLASFRRDIDANPKEVLSNLRMAIKEAVQVQEDALGVPSAAGKSKRKGEDKEKALKKRIGRIDRQVQEVQVPSAAGKSKRKGEDKEKALKKRIGRIDGQVQEVQVPSAAGKSKRKGEDIEKALKKRIGRIDGQVQEVQDVIEVPSADKSKGEGDDVTGEVLQQIERIDEVQKAQVPSAAGKSKRKGEDIEKALKKRIGRIDGQVQEVQDVIEVPSADKSKGEGDDVTGEVLQQIEKIDEVQKAQGAFQVPSVADKSKRKGEDKEKAIKKRIGRIDGQVQEVQDVIEVLSADKSKGEGDDVTGEVLQQIERIDEVQKAQGAFQVPSAADKSKGKDDEAHKTLLKKIGRINEAVQVLLNALGDTSADRSKRKDDEAGETLLEQIGRIDEGVPVLLNASSAPSKSKRKGDDNGGGSSVSAAKPAATESLEPEATTSSHD